MKAIVLRVDSPGGSVLASEEIYREVPAGTYRMKVKGYNGAFNTNVPYGLKFMQLSESVQVLSSTGWVDDEGNLNVDGEILNNTDNRRRLAVVRVTLYNNANQVIGTKDAYAWINVIRPRTRSPFRVSMEKPSKYDHYSVAVSYSQKTTDYVVQNIGITSSTRISSLKTCSTTRIPTRSKSSISGSPPGLPASP